MSVKVSEPVPSFAPVAKSADRGEDMLAGAVRAKVSRFSIVRMVTLSILWRIAVFRVGQSGKIRRLW
ncbi:MAG: hypothetical protein JWS10_2581 [Cypionkella sp.]|nr:hypothetical protein [Cypionkella sp.]